ncbi:MAG: hypothetical protein K0R54_4388 [Clostridiaceae bacterium]|jgi:Zn-dependent peptidase ImmA (M78 family)|nr:hypothetical protein [Clostridiaceae bacterium]
MTVDEIIDLANGIKRKYDRDPIRICNQMGIPIHYTNLKPNIYPAYTLKVGVLPVINLNTHFTLKSQQVLCAHELGHVLLHNDKLINEFGDNHNGSEEYEANLFAVSLLFEQENLNYNIKAMDNYMLKELLNYNIKLIS